MMKMVVKEEMYMSSCTLNITKSTYSIQIDKQPFDLMHMLYQDNNTYSQWRKTGGGSRDYPPSNLDYPPP
jgi:hypothetical protein